MKTKKILAIAISCLLLIGVAVGITASAADAPTVEITGATLSYEGAIRILYTLNTENLAAGQKVKAVFSADPDVSVPAGKLTGESGFISESFKTEINGEACTAVYSIGIAPTAMTDKVYAIPVIVDADDKVVAVGEKFGLSIYDYCMARFDSKNHTDEQYLLYLATLNLGGSIQAGQVALGAEAPANGYANECYVLSVMNGDGSVTEYKFAEPTEYQLVAPKTYNGKLFDHFVDNKVATYENADFNKLTVNLDKPGYTYVKAVYGEIDAVSATIPTGASATVPNPDAVTVNGGSEFFIEGDVTLSDGASATLAFNPDVATVSLSEADGVVTVSDGVSSFTMANGATLRVEYTVLSTTNLTGVIFYYVNGEYVAKSDVTSTQNSSFDGVTAAVETGEATFDAVIVGATSSIMTVANNKDNTTATFEYSEDGKYLYYNKPGTSQWKASGSIRFNIEGGQTVSHAIFEAEMKLKSCMYSNNGNNSIQLQFQRAAGSGNVVLPLIGIWQTGMRVDGTTVEFESPIADDGWFDIKVEVYAAGSDGVGSYIIYINGVNVYETTFIPAYKNNIGFVAVAPENSAYGSIYMRNCRFYGVE